MSWARASEIKIERDSGPKKPSPLDKKTKGGDRSHTPAVHHVGAASSTLCHPRVSTASAVDGWMDGWIDLSKFEEYNGQHF